MSSAPESETSSADDHETHSIATSATAVASSVATATTTTAEVQNTSTTTSSGDTRRQSSSPTSTASQDSAAGTSNKSDSNKKNHKTEPVIFDVGAGGDGGNGDSFNTSPPSQLRYGKCKWFNVAKGWGFITPSDGGVEVFVHQSVIQMNGFRSLGAQEEVEFVSIETPRGVEATFVAGREGLDCVGSSVRPRPQGNRFIRRVRCYNCNRFNHIAAECRVEPQPRRCYICQQEDHLIASCPRVKFSSPPQS